LYELQNGLPYRTVPPGHEHEIDWHGISERYDLNIATSELKNVGIHFLTVGIEVVPPSGINPVAEPLADSVEPAAAPHPKWDPRTEWSVATVKRELRTKGPDKEVIIAALLKLYGNNIPAILDDLVAGEFPQAEKLRKAIKGLLEATAQPPGRTIRDNEIPSRDTCSRFLVAWREYRARQPHQ
jgi:hypothetical protein